MSNVTNTVINPFIQSWYSYPLLYQELRGISLNPNRLIQDFANLHVPPSVSLIESAREADQFFGFYGVGNDLSRINRPYERFHAYELLLDLLFGHDQVKYNAIHKGTPYYFLGWTAFQTENYEKGIYYLDQAVSEDIRKSSTRDISILRGNPAVNSLLLDPQAQAGVVVVLELRAEMDTIFSQFSNGSGFNLNTQTFANNFLIGSGSFVDSAFRTIVTSIYSFVLEYHMLVTSLQLRSVSGGSLEPFFLHLFKGGLLLESILKLKCASGIETLHPAIIDLNTDLQINLTVLRGGSLQFVVQHVDRLIASGASFQDVSFAAAYGIRNTTGHNLVWTDVFQSGTNVYQRLYLATMNAILWSIYKLWIIP